MIVGNGIKIRSTAKGNSRPSGTTLRLTCALPAMQRAQIATRRSLGTPDPQSTRCIGDLGRTTMLPLNNPERNGKPKACPPELCRRSSATRCAMVSRRAFGCDPRTSWSKSSSMITGREFRLPPARPYFQPFIALNRPAIVQPADVGLRKPGGTASKTNAPFYVSDRKKLCSIAGAVRTRCGAHIQGTIAGNTFRRQRQF
jgi:hypothetical protein